MTISTALCTSFLLELARGVHDFDNDTIMAALYTDDASLGAGTTEYTTDGEVEGSGYSAGGVEATVRSGYPQVVAGRVEIRFDPIEWETTSLTYRGVLIYNASKDNRAIKVIDRGMNKTTVNGPISISDAAPAMPLVLIAG
jgi:hypothetical protein